MKTTCPPLPHKKHRISITVWHVQTSQMHVHGCNHARAHTWTHANAHGYRDNKHTHAHVKHVPRGFLLIFTYCWDQMKCIDENTFPRTKESRPSWFLNASALSWHTSHVDIQTSTSMPIFKEALHLHEGIISSHNHTPWQHNPVRRPCT